MSENTIPLNMSYWCWCGPTVEGPRHPTQKCPHGPHIGKSAMIVYTVNKKMLSD